jgi:hypothetical protein
MRWAKSRDVFGDYRAPDVVICAPHNLIGSMRMNRTVIMVSMLLVLTRAGSSQGEPRLKPSFAVAAGAERVEFKPGAPMPVKLTMTNTSDRDLRYTVFSMWCPPPIEHLSGRMRQMQILLYDSEGNLAPLTPYGVAVQGITGPVATPPGAERGQGVACGGGGTVGVLKPGESLIEEADLSKEFDIKKPGRYTIRAQRLDKESKAVVRSEAVTVTFTAAQ